MNEALTTFNEDFVSAVEEQFPDVDIQNYDFLGLKQTHGYKMRFANGLTVSVQFGPATYSSNYDRSGDFMRAVRGQHIDGEYTAATTAEIAGWFNSGEFHDFGWGNDVNGYQSPSDVLEWLKEVAI